MITDLSNLSTLHETIIGVILRNPEVFTTEQLEPRWFGKYSTVIDAMYSMTADNVAIDVLALDKVLAKRGALGRLAEIQQNSPGVKVNYAWFVNQLREQYQGIEIRSALEGGLREIQEGATPKDVLSKIVSASLNMQADTAHNWEYDSKRALSAFLGKLEEAYEAQETGGLGLKTHVGKLDVVLGGIHPSDLCVVGARPSVGKTSCGLSIIYNLLRSGKRVGLFSIEMPTDQIMQRLVSMDTGINSSRIREAKLEDSEFTMISASTTRLLELPLRIFDKPNITLSELCIRARAWAANGGLDLIVVDYLTRIKPDKSTKNHHLDVGDIVSGLKNLARTLNVPVLCLAQLNRAVEGRSDKRPMMSDLRDSGIIEQEADQILMLHRAYVHDRETSPTEAEIIVTKNRPGECGIVLCKFNTDTTRWVGRFDD